VSSLGVKRSSIHPYLGSSTPVREERDLSVDLVRKEPAWFELQKKKKKQGVGKTIGRKKDDQESYIKSPSLSRQNKQKKVVNLRGNALQPPNRCSQFVS